MSRRVRVLGVLSLGLAFLLTGAFLAPASDEKAAPKKPDAPAEKELAPKLFTLQKNDVTLKEALQALREQTGNEVENRRENKEDTKFNLSLKGVTFWQALDAVAEKTDSRIELFEEDGKISLRDGPFLALPTSYSGLFKLTIKQVEARKMLEPEAHFLVVHLDIAWEPRFQPFVMTPKPDDLVVEDDKGVKLKGLEDGGRGSFPVSRKNGTTMELRTPAPKRSAQHLGLLKGSIGVVGPMKMLDFTFDNLARIEKPTDARKQTKEGVLVSVRGFRLEDDSDDKVWAVDMLLEYPVDGVQFESFQSWLVANEIFLEKEANGVKLRFPCNAGTETDQGGNRANIRYRFADQPEKKLVVGKPEDWKLLYRTPGKIVDLSVPFEFKEVPLP